MGSGNTSDIGYGFFSSVTGTVKNLEIRNSIITILGNRFNVGVFAGRVNTASASIENCVSSNNHIKLITGTVKYVGGMVGIFLSGKNDLFYKTKIIIFILSLLQNRKNDRQHNQRICFGS